MEDEDPAVRALERIRRRRELLEAAELEAVMFARRCGYSWGLIAAALDVTRQAAWERFAHREPAHWET